MKLKNITAFLLIALALYNVCAPGASATIAPQTTGDCDLDDRVTVKDATMIQKYLVKSTSFTPLQEYASEVDGDNKVTIKDATMIQKKCAEIIEDFNVDSVFWTDAHANGFYADYNSGKATTGTPVTFTALVDGNGEPFRYEFFINEEKVTEISEENCFTHTFTETGTYRIGVKYYNRFDYVDYGHIYDYKVVEAISTSNLAVKAFYHNNNHTSLHEYVYDTEFTATAMGGSGNYEYAFYLDSKPVQDYSEKNTFLLKKFEDKGIYEITVYIRDLNTNEVVTENMTLKVNDPVVGGYF